AVSGNAIAEARMINNWNLDRGIRGQTPEGLSWKAVTTGNYGGIDLWLKNGDVGAISFETKHCSGTRNIAELGVDADLFPGGGLHHDVTRERLPEKKATTHLRFSRRFPNPKGRDARLFVRVTQEDGHRAWSSPIYLFR